MQIWPAVLVIATIIGIVAGGQQLISAFRRRKYRRAEDKFLEAIEADENIEQAKIQVEQYEKLKQSMRHEIETQIPRQARIAYLSDRFDQLTEDLYRNYRDYENVRRELSESQAVSELDRRVRDAIEISIIPNRKIRERRNIYMFALLTALIVFNVSPIRISDYFYILDYSYKSSGTTILVTMLLGAICLTLMLLVLFSFFPTRTTPPTIANMRTGWVALLLSASVILCIILIAFGLYTRGEAIGNVALNFKFDTANDVNNERILASLAFNAVVIILSIEVASFIYVIQRRAGQTRQVDHAQASA